MASLEEAAAGQSAGRAGKVFMLIAGGISIISLGAAVFFYTQYRTAISEKGSQANELAEVLGQVEQLMELPAGETPTLATVADKEKLSEQAFFKNAENGDKILIYTESGRAVLYRPSSGKIVDVTAVNVQNETTTPETTESPAPEETSATPETIPATEETPSETSAESVAAAGPAQVVFLNGSTKVGVTQAAEDKLMAAYPDGVAVMAKEKASKSDYVGTIIADVTGRAAIKASEVAMSIGGTVGSLPADETIPEGADIVVIIGNSAVPAAAKQ